MNNLEKYKNDILKQYLNPEMIEKAPETFASKVMTNIQIEHAPFKREKRVWNLNIIPVISVAATIFLILAVFLIPGNGNSFNLPAGHLFEDFGISLPTINTSQTFNFITQLFENIRTSLAAINTSRVFSLSLPVWLPYIFIVILMLSVFDRVLFRFFDRSNKQKTL
ncbi:MAG: hypothetical protein LLG13_00470 [Bacteroidales bacterium]|nr:hypothetical protein [Bacteroidales bacterium]